MTEDMTPDEKPRPSTSGEYITIELFYTIGFSILAAVFLVILRASGFVAVPWLAIAAAPLSIFAVGRSTRIFYPISRWHCLMVDGVDLDHEQPRKRIR